MPAPHSEPASHSERTFPPEPQSARSARALLRTCLARWGLSGLEGDASVALSELVTNGVMHARTSLVVAVRRDDDWLEVSVADDSPWPVQRRPHRRDIASDLVVVAQTEQQLGHDLDDRDARLDVGSAGTLAGGRGLLLVEALADQWGVTPRGTGKAVWARFAITAAADGSATTADASS